LRPCCNGASRLSSRQNLGCHGWYKLHVIALSNLDVLLITAEITGRIFISSRRASSLYINQALRLSLIISLTALGTIRTIVSNSSSPLICAGSHRKLVLVLVQ